ncbi:response regulator [Methylogaea oryzae]|nr:response regulator [Methylogaea oryzae]
MTCSTAPGVWNFLRGDPMRLRQVLSNLIGNAVKFTAAGEIDVALEVVGGDRSSSTLRFTVRDTGIGIAKEKLPRLFDAFTQADGSTTRQYGGSGLGLTIVKQLVALMGGEIEVESEEGKGTAFAVTITFAHGREHLVHYRPLGGMRVLVVDDNDTNLLIVRRYLENWGVAVTCESDPRAAIGRMRDSQRSGSAFDTVLLDFQMPHMDGSALAKAIRAEAGLADTDMVMLSSVSVSPEAMRAAGIRALLIKPVQINDLYSVLSARLAESPRAEALTETSVASAMGMHILLVDDNPTNMVVAKAMLVKQGHRVDVAANGLEALRFLEHHVVDCIFMDCLMPEMDGYEATQAIRRKEADSGGRRTPIIALTANALQGDRERCLAVGMDDYLTKPFKREQIREMLQRWVTRPLSIQTPGGDEVNDTDTASGDIAAGRLLDEAAIAELRELLGDQLPDFLRKFHETSTLQLQAARVALAQADVAALQRSIHTLKGSAGAVGAMSLADACLAFELRLKAGNWENAVDHLAGIERLLQAVSEGLDRCLTG